MPEIDLTPDLSLAEDIGAGSFTIPEAISELVANSFDERVDSEPIVVKVVITNDTIWVIDNCRGMALDELGDMMVLGYKNIERKSAQKTRKGMYGLGLKTACASMGRLWGVHTKTSDSHKTHSFEMDLEEWSKKAGLKTSRNWVGNTESRAVVDGSPLNDNNRGTAIYVKKLRQSDTSISAVSARLSKAYKPHLDSGDEIYVNGEKLVSDIIEIREDSRIEIDQRIGPDKSYHIHGWFGVGPTSNEGNFGINIYRQNQLVETWNKDWFKAHAMTSRIRGDVHLDFVPSNFHKKGLDKTSLEWKMASEAMQIAIEPVKKLSYDLSRNRNDVTRDDRAFKAFSLNLSTLPQLIKVSEDKPAGLKEGQPTKEKSTTSEAKPRAQILGNRLEVDGISIALVRKINSLSSKVKHWDYIFDEKKSELLVVLNSSSSIYANVEDKEFLGVLAQADVIASFLIERRNWKPSEAREIRDAWLSNHFDSKEKR